ncbi:MAG: class I SAM-dependent methyltransferase [Candidatus Dormiibacterota bacterium]
MERPSAVERFTGFADLYDATRPSPPPELVDLLCQWIGTARPFVVDVGAGTGLSTSIWERRARRVVAVEPSADMRARLQQRLAAWSIEHEVLGGSAEATGLEDGVADLVTAGQAMHWFDPDRSLPEIARILRPGGVFAAFDCDWPPLIDAEVDAAYLAAERRCRSLEAERELTPRRQAKSGHLARMAASGVFRLTREVALHHRGSGGADQLLDLIGSQGGIVALRQAGVSDEAMGLAELRRTAERRLPEPATWWWTYRVRLGQC